MNTVYPFFFGHLHTGLINFDSDTVTMYAVTTGGANYNFSSGHQFLSSVAGGDRVSLAALSLTTDASGVVDAADTVFPSASGADIGAVIFAINKESEANSPLWLYMDIASGDSPILLTPSGNNIDVSFPQGGIYSLI